MKLLAKVKQKLSKGLDALTIYKMCLALNEHCIESCIQLAIGYNSARLEDSIIYYKKTKEVLLKIKEKLDQGEDDTKVCPIYHRLMINGKIHPFIDFSIFTCCLKTCLGGIFSKIPFLFDKNIFDPAAREISTR